MKIKKEQEEISIIINNRNLEDLEFKFVRKGVTIIIGENDVGKSNILDHIYYNKETQKALKIHGDIAPGNLLVKNGKLCGVIDFGMLGIGDPSCDYAIAWTFFDKESRKTFLRELGCDKDT
ncbi:5905_t:CDS:2 [Entrophospora sp. SA101]|nr:5905_t:CDS:2 [Entrophospora sp. SA101]